SPAFTGLPTAPTRPALESGPAVATLDFVHNAITIAIDDVLANSIVASFNGRTGDVVLTLADVAAVGGAPLASPAFTGTPTAPSAPVGSTGPQIATLNFVHNVVAAAIASLDPDFALLAPINSPVFTGDPRAPNQPITDNDTSIANTAFVHDSIALLQ